MSECPVEHPLSCLWILVERQRSRNSVLLCVIKNTGINCNNKTRSITAMSLSNFIICNTAI